MSEHQGDVMAQKEGEKAPRVPKTTYPVEEHRRMKDDEIRIEIGTIEDMPEIADGIYACFTDFLDKREPDALRDSDTATRSKRLATRLSPSFHLPQMRWIKAVYAPTGQIAGVAGWLLPGMPIHNYWRRSATDFFGFKDLMNWTDADIKEMWKGVDLEYWEGSIGGNDRIREGVLGEEPHWFLAPLLVLPEFQGRGVASKLLGWAIERADREVPVQPLYLESSPMARNVYMRFGFEAIGEANFLRRGPGGVSGGDGKGEKVEV